MSNWLTYSPTSGHGNTQITLSASTLTDLEDRIATLIATGSQEGQTLSATTVITQKYLTLTEIYFENLTWSTDVACSGGTATKDNCSFSIIAKYSDNSTKDITSEAEVTGSLVVPLTTAATRQSVGTLTVTATYEDKTCTGSVEVYQEATSLSEIFFNNLEWVTDIPASGGTATKNNCNYSVYAKYSNNIQVDITSEAEVTGSLIVENSIIEERHSAGTLMLTAEYENLTCNGSVTAYQELYYRDYLKFTFVSGGTWTYTDSSAINGIEYSINNGKWTLINSKELSVLSGDTIRVRGRNRVYNGRKFGGTAYFNLSGNIMALIGDVNYENLNKLINEINDRAFTGIFANSNVVEASELLLPATALTVYCYGHMFQNCKSLTSVPALPATTLAINCYQGMFLNCTSLTTAPALPATTLAEDCYTGMFQGCTSLTTAPELPARTLVERCYYAMFSGCKSLTTAPELPVTELDYYCYSYMFSNCTSLTNAPALPATTLKPSCYDGMFEGCSSLTTAPELPATTLAQSCYSSMFKNCSSLNYIKCLSEPINQYYAENWVQGVASTGTFVKNPKMVSWGTGDSGIPSGWTVINAS